jgi:tetratricopeptide (TPR) repeat protein
MIAESPARTTKELWERSWNASEFIERGEAAKALAILDGCVALGVGWPRLLRSRAKLALGREAAAMRDATAAFNENMECGWIFDLPVLRLERPHGEIARRLYERNRGFRESPACFLVRAHAGRLKLICGRREGLEDIEWALCAAPKRPFLHAWKAEALRRLRLPGAQEEADAAIALDPDHWLAYATRAALLRQRGRVEDALTDAVKVASLAPKHEHGHLEAARACLKLNRGQNIFYWLERAAGISGRYGWWAIYEDRSRDFGDIDRLTRDPKLRVRAMAWRGEANLAMGRAEAAARDLEFSVKNAPRFALAQAWLGEALSAQGKMDAALACFDKALKLDDTYSRAWVGRARLFLSRSEPKRALADIDRAIKKEPMWAWTWFWKAAAFEALGRSAQAIEALDRAVLIHPLYAEAILRRGNLRRSEGDFEGALDDLRRYRALREK